MIGRVGAGRGAVHAGTRTAQASSCNSNTNQNNPVTTASLSHLATRSSRFVAGAAGSMLPAVCRYLLLCCMRRWRAPAAPRGRCPGSRTILNALYATVMRSTTTRWQRGDVEPASASGKPLALIQHHLPALDEFNYFHKSNINLFAAVDVRRSLGMQRGVWTGPHSKRSWSWTAVMPTISSLSMVCRDQTTNITVT
jgi:hypothetical protein